MLAQQRSFNTFLRWVTDFHREFAAKRSNDPMTADQCDSPHVKPISAVRKAPGAPTNKRIDAVYRRRGERIDRVTGRRRNEKPVLNPGDAIRQGSASSASPCGHGNSRADWQA